MKLARLLLPISLLAGGALLMALFVMRTDARIDYDDAVYLYRGLYHAAQVSERGDLLLPRLVWSLGFEAPKPPLFHGLIALGVLAFGRGHLGAILVLGTLLPLLALALAIYGLAREAASPRAGLLALATYLAMPAALWLGTRLLTETTLAATVVGGTFFFFRRARRRAEGGGLGDEIGAGVCSGLSLLAKLLGPLFLAPVGALALWECWRAEGPRRAGRLFAVVTGIAVAIAGPWYLRNGRAALAFGEYSRKQLSNLYGSPGWMRPLDFVRGTVGLAAVLLLLALLAREPVADGGGRLLRWMVLGSAALSACVIGIQPMFDPRFWLPAAALLAVWSGVAFDTLWLARPFLRWLVPAAMAALVVIAIRALAEAPRPQTPWNASRAIERLAMTPSGPPRLCTLGDNADWNVEKLRLAVELSTVRPRPAVSGLLVEGRPGEVASRLAGCDVVFALRPGQVPRTYNQQALEAEVTRGWAQLAAVRAFEPSPTLEALLDSRARPAVFVRRRDS